jgi:tRNA pseudouridine38-40 synthase
MPRYRLTLEYNGAPFVGWQKQADDPSVQEALEKAGQALSKAPAPSVAAGRTDAGVHAVAMSVHIDLAKDFPTDTVRDGLNAHLGKLPIAVTSAQNVSNEFHARFSCIGRQYFYRIAERRSPPVLDAGRVWHIPYALDAEAMRDAAQCLIGEHDFTSFRASMCQAKSPVKTLDKVEIFRARDEIILRFAARSFLHNQIRSLVGSLERVGADKWAAGDMQKALEAKSRTACGPVAPAHGLYFEKAVYPDDAV